MTINDLANVVRCNVDKDTQLELSHDEKWSRVVNALGYDAVKACIPFDYNEISEAIKDDKHLNNLDLRRWDSAGGFYFPSPGSKPQQISSALTKLLRKAGVTNFSPSDSVCILKCAARMWVQDNRGL